MGAISLNGLKIEWLKHDCFKIKDKRVIYFDPFQLSNELEPADLILITHEHFDHCSIEDIQKIIKKTTIIVAAEICKKSDLPSIEGKVKKIVYMKPNSTLPIDEITIEAIPAYNVNKFKAPGVPFHPKGENRVGFVLNYEGKRIYHAGDTDYIPEISSLKNIDVALLPVSGTYVMTAEEAAEAVKNFRPKLTIPMHIEGGVVGTYRDARRFKDLASNFTKVEIL
ncbi:MAG: MBL fold metallo-hydrolase [Candidatus Aenigmatarchaeota archaeon]